MKALSVKLLLVATLSVVASATANALILCVDSAGYLRVSATCEEGWRQLDPVALGLQGAPGPQGIPSTPGAAPIKAPPIAVVDNPLGQIVRYVRANSQESPTEIANYVMWFVHEHSVEETGPWHDQNWLNGDVIFSGMVNAFRGFSSQKPFMTCGPRSVAMGRILRALGIESRQVGLFTDDAGTLLGHQLVEIRTRDGRWEAYDPTWNVYYVNKQTGERVSVRDLLFGDLDDLVPSSPDGLVIGWDATRRISRNSASPMSLLRYQNYFSAALYYTFTTKRRQIMLINSTRFDQTAKLVDETPFRAWADKTYNRPEWIVTDAIGAAVELAIDDGSNLPTY